MNTNGLEIAIIGMAGRFPGADSIEQFWENLKDGVESIALYDDAFLREQGVEAAMLNHPQYVKAGAALANVEWFDAEFFGFSPREAEILDPQHRLFLECAWTALEQAGYDSERYDGAIALFAGAAINGYLFNLYTNPTIRSTVSPYQLFLASDKDFLTTRVSYKLNLKGASVTVQTACSTSLVAVHLACQSLLAGECDMALAGGVAVSKQVGYLYQEGGIFSPDGHCRAFDAQAQGTVAGSGLGVVVLKRLEDAIADGDSIAAIIKGSAINNDGSLKVSYTAPSVEAQAQVIQTAQLAADVPPETISYLEAHGTGTALGDPIELAALSQAFRSDRPHCAIGSLKTNIGHLDTAAGIASLIKTVLAMQHRQIPPSLHFSQPNPQINFSQSPFYVNTALQDWNASPRRAGVSSFGIGGTNAHVILEEAPPLESATSDRSHHLLILSAKTPTALDTATANLAAHLRQHPDRNLADVAFTLQEGRRNFNHRRTIVCDSIDSALTQLLTPHPSPLTPHPRSIAFLFPGQGTQYAQMGRDLYESEPVFREAIDRCNRHLTLDLLQLLYSPDTRHPIPDTQTAQPILFAIEYALAQLWLSWGIRPDAMMGHSIGEYVAATLAGVFSLEDALKLVAMRGRLMQQQPTGSMLAVSLSEAEIQSWLSEAIALAAVNAPQLCVVAGTEEAIDSLQTRLEAQAINCRRLHTSHAFHSPMMQPVCELLIQAFDGIAPHPPQIPFISNLTGTWITAEQAIDPAYWAAHLRQTVRCADGIATLLQVDRLFVEVGAGNSFSTFVKAANREAIVCPSLRHAQDDRSNLELLLTSLGTLWRHGVPFSGLYAHEQRRRIPLPTYPFERQRYWVDPQPELLTASSPEQYRADWFFVPSWERDQLPLPTNESHCWLLFVDRSGVGDRLAQQLQQTGHDVVTVAIGESFAQVDYRAFTVHPQRSSDYVELLQDLQMRELVPDRVVHLWSLDQVGYETLLPLTQAIAKLDAEVSIVTTQTQDVIGDAIEPVRAGVLAFAQVVSQEYPNLICRCLDVDATATSADDRLVTQLLAEIQSDSIDRQIAYRGGYRWRQVFRSLRLESEDFRWHEQGCYLFIGNLQAGLGAVWATQLAQTIPAQIVLIGDDRQNEQWARSLEALGAKCLVISADVTDVGQMEAAIAQAEAHGKIHGAFYSTAIADSLTLISELDVKTCEDFLAAKLNGVAVLEKVLQERYHSGSASRSLEFCLLQSSLASVVGGIGLAAYAAANRALDAVVARHQFDSTRWISVNWDACEAEPSTPFALTPAEVWSATCRILAADLSGQVVVSKGDLSARMQPTPKPPDRPVARSTRSTEYVAPRDPIEEAIANVWQELLGVESVGIHDSFFELGGHSLLAIQAIARLRELFRVELPLRNLLFEAPTIAKIAAAITAQQPEPTELAAMAEILSEIQALSPEAIEQLATDTPPNP